MKKLNNKGFTLIELLAVIVILALIMVIAIPNVLNSMNNSRLSTLHSKAKSIVEAYSTAYASEQVMSGSSSLNANTINFVNAASGWTCINPDFADFAELDASNYNLSGSTGISTTAVTSENSLGADSCSAIMYANGKLQVLLVANPAGKFHYSGKTVTYAYSEDSEGKFK